MTLSLLALYTTLAAVFAKAVLVKLQALPPLPPSCARCGLPRERRELGERICGCSHSHN